MNSTLHLAVYYRRHTAYMYRICILNSSHIELYYVWSASGLYILEFKSQLSTSICVYNSKFVINVHAHKCIYVCVHNN